MNFMKKIILLSLMVSSGLLFLTSNAIAQNWVQKDKTLCPPYTYNFLPSQLGASVAVDSNYSVVGDPLSNGGKGAAYVLYFNGTTWVIIARLKASSGSLSDDFGCSVSISGDNIVVGSPNGSNSGTNSGSAYVFTKPVSGWADMTETAKLSPSSLAPDYTFGWSVSIYGDDIVVGSLYSNVTGIASGSAYIFTKPVTGWTNMTQTAIVHASDYSDSDQFGYSVCIFGNAIVVGAPYKSSPYSYSGASYLFLKPLTGWTNCTEDAKLLPTTAVSNGQFGHSVSMTTDNIAIGAPHDGFGAVHVFTKPVLGWINMTSSAKLTPYPNNMDEFGTSVSISGDIVVAGSPNVAAKMVGVGAAFIFKRPVAGWTNMTTHTAKLTPFSAANYDYFGSSVAISGSRVVIGSPHFSQLDFIQDGSAYLFIKPPSGWVSTNTSRKVYPPAYLGNVKDYYGYSVAIDSNYAVVGAYGYKDNRGAAYVLYNNGSNWINIAKLTPTDSSVSNKYFGKSVSISGNTIVIGASQNFDNNCTDTGSVYVFVKPITGWANMNQTAKLRPSDGNIGSSFGCSVSISGDNIVVGARGNTCAYVFNKPLTGWHNMFQTGKLTCSTGGASNSFGCSVSIADNDIVVGSYLEMGYGSAFVYTKPLSGWTNMVETAKLVPSNGTGDDYFGYSVGISGNTIVVGAYGNDSVAPEGGMAYVYTKPGTVWVNSTQKAKLVANDANVYSYFGRSVAINGDNIVIGTFYHPNNYAIFENYGYVFQKPLSGWHDTGIVANLKAIDGDKLDVFSCSVGISGDNIILGAFRDQEQGDNSGSAYIFGKCLSASVSQVGDTLSANISGATYQWLNCNNNFAVINGANNQSFIPSINGNYAVEVTQNVCIDTSACINIALGMGDNNENSKSVLFPNPANNTLYFDGLSNTATAEIYDISGKLLLRKQLNENQLDIRNLAKGLYFIKLSTEEGSVVRKFVKE